MMLDGFFGMRLVRKESGVLYFVPPRSHPLPIPLEKQVGCGGCGRNSLDLAVVEYTGLRPRSKERRLSLSVMVLLVQCGDRKTLEGNWT